MASHTSITIKAATEHIKAKDGKKTLFCKLLKNFYLIRLANGGSWRYRYKDSTGKVRHITIGRFPLMRPEVAAKKAYQWIIEDNADPFNERETKKKRAISTEQTRKHKTLGRYLTGRYTRVMETWPPQSAKINKQRLESHFAHLLETPMDEIEHRHIEDWQEQQQEKGLANSTVQRIYNALRALLRQAVQHKVIAANPLEGFSLAKPSFKEQQAVADRSEELKEKRRILTADEIQALHKGLEIFTETIRQQRRNSRAHGKSYLPDLDAVAYPHWFQPFCLLALHTGLRPGDIYSLTWRELNINFAKLVKVTGKSARSIREGKGGISVEIKLNQHIHEIMKSWWEQNGKPTTGPVFSSPVTGVGLDTTAHKKHWKAVKELAGLPKELNFYALRHHFISVLVASGMPLAEIAKRVGHRTTMMIELHYHHLSPEKADQAVDVVGFGSEPAQSQVVAKQ